MELTAQIQEKTRLLRSMAEYLYKAIPTEEISGRGRPIEVSKGLLIPGPRAGAIELYAGVDSGRLYSILSAHDSALARQFVTWQFRGEPSVGMRGRYIRIEAGWPEALAEHNISLSQTSELGKRQGRWVRRQGRWLPAAGDGRWIVGVDEQRRIITAGVDASRTPHFLISGTSGSGKTSLIRSILIQLAADPSNRIVVIDGKRGRDYMGHDRFFNFSLARLNGLVGPIAATPEEWLSASAWVSQELNRRFENPSGDERRIVLVVDEVQEVMRAVPAVKEAIRRAVTMGRSAKVHTILATQHPVVDELGGPTIARNLMGRLALLVDGPDASRVAVGGAYPRADFLLGRGDGYTITPGEVYRTQAAYPETQDAEAVSEGIQELEAWPDSVPEDMGQAPQPGRGKGFEAEEIAVSLIAAANGNGRPAMVDMLQAAFKRSTGGQRARDLLALGRSVHTALTGLGYTLSDRHEGRSDQ